jgi:hypothetical protein
MKRDKKTINLCMNPKKLLKLIAGLLTCFGCTAPAFAQGTLSVDMDIITPGIQSTRSSLGPFTAGLVMTVGPGGVSSYGISILFDNTELSLVGAPASTELQPLPGGINITAGVALESQALGQVYTFEAATLGLGPVSTSFTIGTINFTATALVNDGLPDITLGFYNAGIDGMFDNAGFAVVPVFANASVVPEPSTAALLLCGTLASWMLRRGRHS